MVDPEHMPDSIYDLADPRWKGRTGIAKPLFGTTATHAACLFAQLGSNSAREFFRSLKDNAVQVHSGNKSVALSVAAGRLAFGLTDTDDAMIELENGQPVRIVYPDRKEGQAGVLFVPNALALVKGAPHAEEGRALIEYLLSPKVEAALADDGSAQIPLNPRVTVRPRVTTPHEVKAMQIDFSVAAEHFDEAAAFITESFLR